jgi:hypothetical protein
MQDAFRLGGWGMYPTLFVGSILLVAAARFAMHPARGRLAPIVGLGVLTFLTSLLGFVTGLIKTMSSASEIELFKQGNLIVVGIGESMHNIGFGLVLLVLATAGVVVGIARRPAAAHRGASELVDPLV